jgi:hypothetical protein
MEKWAKSFNARQEAMKEVRKVPTTATFTSMSITIPVDFAKKESSAADAGWAMLEKKPVDEKKLMPPPTSMVRLCLFLRNLLKLCFPILVLNHKASIIRKFCFPGKLILCHLYLLVVHFCINSLILLNTSSMPVDGAPTM